MMIRARTLFLLSMLAPGLAAGATLDERIYAVSQATATPRAYKAVLKDLLIRREQTRRKLEEFRARALSSRSGYSVSAVLKRLPVPPPAQRRLAKDQGGVVVRADRAGVSVPAAALASDLDISVANPVSDARREAASAEKKLSAASLPVAFGPEGTVFSAPVTATLPYDASLARAQGVRESDLKIHYWNPKLNAWEPIPSRVDAAVRTVSAEVMHFSIYQVLGPGGGIGVAAAETALGFKAAYVFPNPVRGQNTVTLRVQPGQADSVTVRVYDLAGRKVHESSNFSDRGAFNDGNGLGPQFTYDHVWDVSGIGSGVYTYAVTAKKAGQADIVKSGKVAVVK